MKWNPLHWLGSGGSALAAVVPSCPLCAAASGGLLSSLGLGAVVATGVAGWLVPLFLGLGIVSLGVAARRHRVWWNPLFGLGGASLLYWGWLANRPVLLWAGIAVVVTASVDNTWRQRRRVPNLVQIGQQGEVKMTKRKIEVFTAGCCVCDEALEAVRQAACTSCEVEVRPMSDPENAAAAKEHGIRSLPAVVIDGKLGDCWAAGGVDIVRLRELGLGQPAA